ncbi:Calx-beta domain-containing protein [Aquimarina sp. 2304DJ70-9]|uniref:Calx-beta domain-containing protein n=1 Tax=Aquimarina penaris TaxID=3231044 RepID=UPI003462FC62
MKSKHYISYFLFILLILVSYGNSYAQDTYADNFGTVAYTNNDGNQNWANNWTEANDDNSANSGFIQITGGRLFFDFLFFENIRRTADLSAATSATLSFDWETVSLDGTEALSLFISDGTGFTQIIAFTGTQTGTFTQDISAFISATTIIAFGRSGGFWEGDDSAFIDNVLISATGATPELSITDVTVNENAGTADLTVSHTGANTTGGFTVEYSTANNTALAGPTNDYINPAPPTPTISFSGTSPENQTLTVPITIVDDNFAEATESFFVNLANVSDPSVTITDGQGEITITDNDPASIAINDITVNEAAGTATFTVTLSGASVSGGFSVPFTFADGTATDPADYISATATGSPINFAGTINETQQITVSIVDDNDIEGDHNFFVNLGAPSNTLVTVSDATGEATIEDNDAALSINNVSVNENAGTITFTVTHIGPDTSGSFTVDYATADNTATAGVGNDYTADSNTLNFTGTSGDTETITITILDDIVVEGDETFFINFSNVSDASVDITDQGIGTIIDVEIENPRPYEERITLNVRGNFDMIGNTNLICTANCPGTPVSNNPTVVMGYANIDVTRTNSSSADLTLPVGATVAWAGLYWGGSYNSTFGGITNPNPALSLQQVQFREAGAGTYTTVNAGLTNIETGSFAGWNTFMSYADVTSLVQAAGSGTYTVADIPLITGSAFTGPFGGWTMVIIYENPADITRSVSIWDGFDFFGFGANDNFTVTGLLTPSTGAFDTDAGYFGFDGDSGGFTGDFVAINGTALSNGLNPANNTLNSTISKFGVDVGGRNPNQSFNWGIDIDIFDATGFVPNNATTLAVDLGSASEGIWGGVFAVSTEVAFPAVASKNFSPTSIGYGEESTVTIVLDNPSTGVDLTNLSLTDNLPTGMNISITPNATSSCGGTIAAVAGSDNFTISGVNLLAGNSCTFTFDVIGTAVGDIDNTVSSGDITNDQGIPLAGTTTGTLNVFIRTVVTNRKITYRVNSN